MEPRHQERIYSVVRYEDQFPLGRVRKIVKAGLTLEEAEKLAAESDLHLHSEDIVVEREDRSGAAAEVAGEKTSQH